MRHPTGYIGWAGSLLSYGNGAASQTDNGLQYVDDLAIYQACSVDDVQKENELQEITDELCEWANRSKMVLNTDKCQIMLPRCSMQNSLPNKRNS